MQDRWQRNRVSRASSHPYSRAEVTADCSVYTHQRHETCMARDRRRLLEHFSFGKCEQRGGFLSRLKKSGT
jgi:hypothetical protein